MTLLPSDVRFRDSPLPVRMVVAALIIGGDLVLSAAFLLCAAVSRFLAAMLMRRDAAVSADVLNAVVPVEKRATGLAFGCRIVGWMRNSRQISDGLLRGAVVTQELPRTI